MVSLSADHRHRQAPGRSLPEPPGPPCAGSRDLRKADPVHRLQRLARSRGDRRPPLPGPTPKPVAASAETAIWSRSPRVPLGRAKIGVHAFRCVLTLAIAHLMRCQAAQAGMDFSVRELLYVLAAIRETVLLHPSAGGRRGVRRMLTAATQPAAHVELCGLGAYIPALRSYIPVATNRPSVSANTTSDQESKETRASLCARSTLIANRDVPIVSARWQNLAQWSGVRSLAEQMAGRLREPG
jgi:hypothetical protein